MSLYEIKDDNGFRAVFNEALNAITELDRAINIHGDFSSFHGGYAVILEEMDELWQEIKHGSNAMLIHDEAIQVAACAIRIATMARLHMEI